MLQAARHLKRFRTFSRQHGGTSNKTLERSSSTNSPDISAHRRVQLLAENGIVTLDPTKFAERKQQRLYIGNLQFFYVPIMLNDGVILQSPPLWYDRTHWTKVRHTYPPDIKAFLYYTVPSERPRIGGELRLRVTSSDDPASFANGSDLLGLNGQLWSRPLFVISKKYLPLYAKLREDQLVTDDLDSILSTLPGKRFRYSLSQILYTLNDTFIIDFSIHTLLFSVITEQGMEKLLFRSRFFDKRDLGRHAPYTGSALARFERSTLPEHAGTRTVVLRFLKIITPVKCVMPLYDGYIACPKEGELFQRARKNTLRPQVWSANIDRATTGQIVRGFQLLWDT